MSIHGALAFGCQDQGLLRIMNYQVVKLFREHLNTTAGNYITLRRMEKARHLLAFSSLPITEIAEQCGYRYEYYFAREFKRHSGISPRQYRLKKDHRGNFS